MRGVDRAGGLIFHAPIGRRRNGDGYQLSGSLDFTPIARSCEGACFGEPKVLLAYKADNSPSWPCTEKLLLRDQRGQAYRTKFPAVRQRGEFLPKAGRTHLEPDA